MLITEPIPGTFNVTAMDNDELIIEALADYHKISNAAAVQIIFENGLKRYIPRTLVQIEGAPKNK